MHRTFSQWRAAIAPVLRTYLALWPRQWLVTGIGGVIFAAIAAYGALVAPDEPAWGQPLYVGFTAATRVHIGVLLVVCIVGAFAAPRPGGMVCWTWLALQRLIQTVNSGHPNVFVLVVWGTFILFGFLDARFSPPAILPRRKEPLSVHADTTRAG